MDRIPVTSSNIRAIGYDANSETLEVEFLNDSAYQYSGVPQSVFDELMSAESHGTYFNAKIKGHYPYSRL